jgi:transcriptional regulator GlxA family with amidase domain
VRLVDDETLQAVQRAQAYIEQHCHEDIYVPDLVQKLGVSYRRFHVGFLLLRGQTLVEAVNAARIQRAKVLLRKTLFPLPEVAARCGFKSRHYFHQVFRRQVGVTPRVYRSGIDSVSTPAAVKSSAVCG